MAGRVMHPRQSATIVLAVVGAELRYNQRRECPPPMNAFPDIPGYRIERRLGEGGMASVYLATQLALDRLVAIKVVHFRGSGHDQMAVRFEHEARTIARLEHPNIVGIYEVGRTREGSPYYSMAYLPNGDLSHAELGGELGRIADILRSIASALGFAHSHGVVHRDVKPDNVLFDREQRARLADFGISRSVGSVRVTTTGDAMGSSAYMSPEQARGQEVDARSDLYSLGVMAYELLTGELPFHGTDAVSMALAHHTEPIPRLPQPLARWQPLIDRSLAKRPEDRVQTADEFIAIIDRILAPGDGHTTEPIHGYAPVSAAAATPRGAAIPPMQRSRLAMMLLLTVALALAAAVWWQGNMVDSESYDIAPVVVPKPVDDPELATIAERIEADHWFQPRAGSASERLAAVLASGRSEPRLAMADALVGRVRAAVVKAIGARRDAEAITLLRALREFVTSQQLQTRAASGEMEQAVARALEKRLAAAEAASDPGVAEGIAVLLEQDASFSLRWMQLLEARRSGQPLQDSGGPAMRVLRVGDDWLAFAEHEVTRAEYGRFVASTRRGSQQCRQIGAPLSLVRPRTWREPGFDQSERHPVVCVSYDDARAYAAWLSQQTGRKYRLPSAAEWRAAAAGVDAKTSSCRLGNVYGDDQRELSLRERYGCSDGAADTSSVGRYAASADGLYDLVGNVAEWVSDCAARGECEERKIMGSSYRDGRNAPLLGLHDTKEGDSAALDVGFRVVREM
jgi:formylglycine-generating enzyme required for sulfatase activity